MIDPVPAGGSTSARVAGRGDDAAAMLLSLAADLPHPPRERPMPGRDDSLRVLADWSARTAGASDEPLRRPRLLGLCGPDGSRTATAMMAAAGLDVGDRRLAPEPADLYAAVAAAQRAVDAEVDEGADLLVIVGDALDRPAALALVSLQCRIEPALLMPYASARDDAEWMRELSLVRDARRAAAAARSSAAHAACAAGGAVVIAAIAVLLQAARRRTPAIIDGLTPAVAAMTASAIAPGAAAWWRLAGDLPAPADSPIAARLGLDPICRLGADAPTGAAAALGVTMLRMAVAAAR